MKETKKERMNKEGKKIRLIEVWMMWMWYWMCGSGWWMVDVPI